MSAWSWVQRILSAVPGAVAAGRSIGGLFGRGGDEEDLDPPLGELETERELREAQERRERRRNGNGRSGR